MSCKPKEMQYPSFELGFGANKSIYPFFARLRRARYCLFFNWLLARLQSRSEGVYAFWEVCGRRYCKIGAPAESLRRGICFLGSLWTKTLQDWRACRDARKRGMGFPGVCGRKYCKIGASMDFRREYYLDKAVFTVCSGDGGIKKVT